MEEELRIRVSKELKDKLEKQAKDLNISVSSFVRMKLSN
jgi:antitoxin component of RelBE/YafQ-DinJ toxin-antitoxin module